MKIVHVVPNLDDVANSETGPVSVLLTATAELGHAVTVVSVAGSQAGTGENPQGRGAADAAGAALKLAAHFARLRPDVVHTHGDALPLGWAAARMFSPLRGPRMVHTLDERALTAVRQAPRTLRAAVWARAEHVAVSDAVASAAETALDLRPRHIVPNPIPVAAYRWPDDVRASERAALGLRRNQVAFLTVVGPGGAAPPGLILDAFARPGMGPARLLIAGAGALRGEIEAQARALDVLGRVDFIGEGRALARVLGAVDALVHAATSGPSMVAEAMAAGLPVIAAQPAAWVSDACGLSVAPDDPAALSAAMKRLAQDRTLARRLGGEGARVAAERFDAAVVARAYASIYEEIRGKR
jgi:glycosyltransferase involved in cell wall biosynthesis